jgi:hypothetical protein
MAGRRLFHRRHRQLGLGAHAPLVGRADRRPAHLQRWAETIRARPAVQKGILMPPSMRENGPDREEKERQFAEEARKMVEMGQSRPSGV